MSAGRLKGQDRLAALVLIREALEEGAPGEDDAKMWRAADLLLLVLEGREIPGKTPRAPGRSRRRRLRRGWRDSSARVEGEQWTRTPHYYYSMELDVAFAKYPWLILREEYNAMRLGENDPFSELDPEGEAEAHERFWRFVARR